MIETEASRLGDLTSRLLRLARLDREEVKPRLEPATRPNSPAIRAPVCEALARPPDLIPQKWRGGRRAGGSELMSLAISQLLENACKYSRPDARVLVELSAGENARDQCLE